MNFVADSRRNLSLVFNGYIFTKGKTNQDGSIRWICQSNRKMGATLCAISCTTLNGAFQRHPPMFHLNHDGTLIHEPPTHGTKQAMEFFDQDAASSNVLPLKQMFEKSVNTYIKNNQIETTDSFEEFSLACPDFENVRHGLSKLRRKETPLLPKTLITIDIDGKYCLTSYHQPFLLFDTQDNNRIIAYSSEYQMEILAKSTQWHGDGTFKSAPTLFAQNYLIHQMMKCGRVSFDYVKNYIYLNRSQFIDMVKSLRDKDLTEYDNQKIYNNYYRLLNYYTKNYEGLYTTKDGNCLFHAVSLNLFGSESNFLKCSELMI